MITREDIRTFLSDREWHSGLEILDHFRGRTPPEKSAQSYYATHKGSEETPEDAAVRLGEEHLLNSLLSTLVYAGVVEQIGGRAIQSRRFRWTSWHCWLCGMRILQGERPVDVLCNTCKESIAKECGK